MMKNCFALLALSVALYGAKAHNWQSGTVLDSKTVKTYVQTGSSTQTNGAATTTGTSSGTFIQSGNSGSSSGTFDATTRSHETSDTQIHGMNLQESQLVIVTADFLFVVSDTVEKGRGVYGSLARAIDNRKHGCHIIIGDPVDFYQEKTTLFVADVDGKECKMDLIRQERVAKPAAPPAAEKKP